MKRVRTALALVPPVIALVFWAPPWGVLVAAGIVAVLCYHEYLGLVEAYDISIPWWLGYPAGYLIIASPFDEMLTLVVIALAGFIWAVTGDNLREVLPKAAFYFFGVVYIFGPWRMVGVIRQYSPHWLFFALAVNWVSDILAFAGGRLMGRHKLSPAISPGKTWEGAIFGLTGAILFGVAYFAIFLPQVPVWQRILISAAGNIASVVGDLSESALKRGAGVKDSSSILPGHGGFLDRVDGTLFSIPVIYLLMRILV